MKILANCKTKVELYTKEKTKDCDTLALKKALVTFVAAAALAAFVVGFLALLQNQFPKLPFTTLSDAGLTTSVVTMVSGFAVGALLLGLYCYSKHKAKTEAKEAALKEKAAMNAATAAFNARQAANASQNAAPGGGLGVDAGNETDHESEIDPAVKALDDAFKASNLDKTLLWYAPHPVTGSNYISWDPVTGKMKEIEIITDKFNRFEFTPKVQTSGDSSAASAASGSASSAPAPAKSASAAQATPVNPDAMTPEEARPIVARLLDVQTSDKLTLMNQIGRTEYTVFKNTDKGAPTVVVASADHDGVNAFHPTYVYDENLQPVTQKTMPYKAVIRALEQTQNKKFVSTDELKRRANPTPKAAASASNPSH